MLLLHELLTRDARGREARDWLLSRRVRPEDVTVMFAAPLREWLDEMPADELATRLTGGLTVLELPAEIRTAIGRGPASDRLRAGAAAEPAVHARHERLAVRRRVAQPDVLAGAAARDAERRGDLPLPSPLPRRRLRDLVRRRRPRLGPGAHGGRRHDAGRRRRRPGRHGRADDRARGEHPRRQHVRRRAPRGS